VPLVNTLFDEICKRKLRFIEKDSITCLSQLRVLLILLVLSEEIEVVVFCGGILLLILSDLSVEVFSV
jgi:hypothetical protein